MPDSWPPIQQKSSKQIQMSSLKSNCSLSQGCILQTCEGDLDEFFKHANLVYPPSLSQVSVLRSGIKSELVHSLENLVSTESAPTVDVLILGGAVIVNMLKPGSAKTFQDYADSVFCPTLNHDFRMSPELMLFGMSIEMIA